MSRDRGLPQHSECFNAREFDLWQKFSSSDLSYLLSVDDVFFFFWQLVGWKTLVRACRFYGQII